MNKISLDAVAREQGKKAAAAGSGRSAEIAEHENPGEATVLVLSGRVELRSNGVSWAGRSGDLLTVPDDRHSLHAREASAVLLTVVKKSTLGGLRGD